MRFSKENKKDIEFIEKWYGDIEAGFRAFGTDYTRPKDYIERALRIMNASKKKNRLLHQVEGKQNYFHEEN